MLRLSRAVFSAVLWYACARDVHVCVPRARERAPALACVALSLFLSPSLSFFPSFSPLLFFISLSLRRALFLSPSLRAVLPVPLSLPSFLTRACANPRVCVRSPVMYAEERLCTRKREKKRERERARARTSESERVYAPVCVTYAPTCVLPRKCVYVCVCMYARPSVRPIRPVVVVVRYVRARPG